MTPLAWGDVCAQRLHRHGLSAPLSSPAEVAAAICGAHAQVLSAAELSIGLRMDDATQDDVRAALWTERSLVKTFGPRGTVHLLPAHELPMWTGALSAIPATNRFPPGVRMTPAQTEQVVAAVGSALADVELTIDELSEAVIVATGSWAADLVMPAFQGMWPRWRQALHTAAHAGVLCFGANRGRKVTYTNPRRWLPGFAALPARTALSEVVRRYLHAYGPATSAHFARWFGAPPKWAADQFATLDLQPASLEGDACWLAPDDAVDGPVGPRRVRLLPYFDAYQVGSHPRPLVFPGVAAQRALVPSGQAGNYPVLIVDGIVRGVWQQRRTSRHVDVTVEPFGKLTARQRRELDDEVERIAAFVGRTADLRIGAVTAGPHA